jgi:hypothetical protein
MVVGVNSSASQITGMRACPPAGGPEGSGDCSCGNFSFVVLSELLVRLGFASFSGPGWSEALLSRLIVGMPSSVVADRARSAGQDFAGD